jgi:hypothetical protein
MSNGKSRCHGLAFLLVAVEGALGTVWFISWSLAQAVLNHLVNPRKFDAEFARRRLRGDAGICRNNVKRISRKTSARNAFPNRESYRNKPLRNRTNPNCAPQ